MESDGNATRIAIHQSHSPSPSTPQPLNPSHRLNSATPAPFPHPQSPAPSTTPAPPSLPATPHVAPSPLVSTSAPSPQRAVKSEPDVKTEPGVKSETGFELGHLEPSEYIASSHQQPIAAGPSVRRKRKLDNAGYSPLEVAEIESRAAAIDYAVSLDQYDTIYASQSRFSSFEDAVDRLLPWHIWQVPEEELILPSEEKEAEDLAQSSAQVADLVNLRRRFAKVRRREGNHPSDLPSLIYMLRESTAQVREEFNTVQAAYRSAKSKHDAIVAEERKAREAAALKERLRREEIERQQRAQYIAQAQAQQAQRAAAAAAAAPARPYQPPQYAAPTPGAAQAYATPPAHPPSATGPPARPAQPPGAAVPPAVHPAAPAPGAPAPVYRPPAAVPAPEPVASAAPASPARPPAPAAPGTPIGVPQPTASPLPASPSTPAAPRGRPRGRPRGSGRGGMRQATVTHGVRPPGTPTTGSAPGTPASGTKQAPVQITVAMTLIPAFVAASLLILPNPQNLKAPATIIRTSDDRKHVTLSIDLASCTQPQLQTLARLLNVQAKMPAAPGAPASGSGPSTGANGGSAASGGAAAAPSAAPATSAASSSAPTTSTAPSTAASTAAPQAPPPPQQQ